MRTLLAFVIVAMFAAPARSQDLIFGPRTGNGIESRIEWSQRQFIRPGWGGGDFAGDWGGGFDRPMPDWGGGGWGGGWGRDRGAGWGGGFGGGGWGGVFAPRIIVAPQFAVPFRDRRSVLGFLIGRRPAFDFGGSRGADCGY